MMIPPLTEIISEDVLRILLQGFYLNTGLSASIFVDPGAASPIYNPEDCNTFCRRMRQPTDPDGCFDRNAEFARRVLLEDDPLALRALAQCKFGLRHCAYAVRHATTRAPVAVMYFGGVLTSPERLAHFPVDTRTDLLMTTEDYRKHSKAFRQFASQLASYYNSHLVIRAYAPDRLLLTTQLAAAAFSPRPDLDPTSLNDTLAATLRSLCQISGSPFAALCILDKHTDHVTPDDMLVVRKIHGLESIAAPDEGTLRGPEIFRVGDSVLGSAIMKNRVIDEPITDYSRFSWSALVRAIGARLVLALPLVPPRTSDPLGGLICFPQHAVWSSELPLYRRFADEVASKIHAAIRSELYRRSQLFSDGVVALRKDTTDPYGIGLLRLVKQALSAAAVSLFVLDPHSDMLSLQATTDETPQAKAKHGHPLYKIGQGITGSVAAQTLPEPYGEIVHDLYADPRRVSAFEEDVPATPSGRHSLIAAQIRSIDGATLGVIRCVDATNDPDGVFHSFNRYSLEALLFWATLLGLLYTLRRNVEEVRTFALTFGHECALTLGAIKNNVELAEALRILGRREEADRKLADAKMIATVVQEDLNDLYWVTPGHRGTEVEESIPGSWYSVERDLLMPIKNSFQQMALEDRQIGIRYETPALLVRVDQAKMIRVLSNVVRNAIKYSWDPAVPEHSQYPREDIAISVSVGDLGRCCISVANSGVGIDEDEKEDIFRLYRKGRRAGSVRAGGLGLGLYVCRAIMARHDGGILVSRCSAPTTLLVWLPEHRTRKRR